MDIRLRQLITPHGDRELLKHVGEQQKTNISLPLMGIGNAQSRSSPFTSATTSLPLMGIGNVYSERWTTAH